MVKTLHLTNSKDLLKEETKVLKQTLRIIENKNKINFEVIRYYIKHTHLNRVIPTLNHNRNSTHIENDKLKPIITETTFADLKYKGKTYTKYYYNLLNIVRFIYRFHTTSCQDDGYKQLHIHTSLYDFTIILQKSIDDIIKGLVKIYEQQGSTKENNIRSKINDFKILKRYLDKCLTVC